jgi:protein-S-isoprenylcysteine O-methyltransferase Ste14
MALLITLWFLFFVSHSLLAANGVKQRAEMYLGGAFRFYRIGYNLLSIIFLCGILYLMLLGDTSDSVFAPGRGSGIAGYVLMGAGLLIVILAFRNYDLWEFTGIKQLAQHIHHPEKLMVRGLNRYVRNPLYTGVIVFIAGYFLRSPNWVNLVSLVMIYLYIYIGATLEERKLAQVFGEEYRAYQQRVKMLIPFLF